ncbi:MAG: LapA family protein [Deltaproteobacteria bacterium]|nr:LapA family protein [Deltaproteobacteria bacterium]
MKVIYTIIVVLFVLFVITFSLENTFAVQLKYHDFITPFTLPAYMLIFISFLGGVVFTGFMGIVERYRLTRTITRLNKTIRDLRRDLQDRETPALGAGEPPATPM